ncbi:MAG: 4-hydroxy-tetrahydrodipicolinate synthase [Planctomycetes bacterium]|nr:4-hydroxy-tetrahydrodipicolinate synthase [Planctomycetota bacterium]
MIVSHPRCRFQGSYAAIPTPFQGDEFDARALEGLIEFLLARGTDGIVVCGTTGEGSTLSDAEKRRVIEETVGLVGGRVPVIAGVGTNSTKTTIESARSACALGVDGLLVVTPYYNKPSPRGLVAHYSAVAEATMKPIVLYNVPSRTGVDLTPEVVAEVGARFTHIVAVKEALPSVERVKRLVGETPVGVLCGDDASIADFMSYGALGVISVLANVMPAEVAELVRVSVPGRDSARAAALVERVGPLARALFVESNPVPLKAVLAGMLSGFRADVRLPLAPLTASSRAELQRAAALCGLPCS